MSNVERSYFGIKQVVAWPHPGTGDNLGRLGYMVRYPDGHQDWSSSEAFEQSYYYPDCMPFEGALAALREGRRVTRARGGKNWWMILTGVADDNNAIPAYVLLSYKKHESEVLADCRKDWETKRLICIKVGSRKFELFELNQKDVLATDWMILDL
jgi:hypothetical protein